MKMQGPLYGSIPAQIIDPLMKFLCSYYVVEKSLAAVLTWGGLLISVAWAISSVVTNLQRNLVCEAVPETRA